MVQKIIHYCWFGGNELPNDAKRCIESWKKYCPDYEIIRWDESNFNIKICDYVSEAYSMKKWAFVSDYARFWILYNFGGVYLDTDVELVASIDDILENGPFMGCENDYSIFDGSFDESYAINSGLGLGLEKSMPIIKELLEDYNSSKFIKSDGSCDLDYTVVKRVTKLMMKYGYKNKLNVIQNISGITIYTKDYFCPLDYRTGQLVFTNNTRSIHHYTESWVNDRQKKINKLLYKYRDNPKMAKLKVMPYIFINKIEELGIIGTVEYIIKKKIKCL